MTSFANETDSHRHSLETLEQIYQHDDFMLSIGTLADLGCGNEGLDVEWWATRTARDEEAVPLNIQCTAINIGATCKAAKKHKNITFLNHDIEQPFPTLKKKFDVLWCHDMFQYLSEPQRTLRVWRNIVQKESMLILTLPQNIEVYGKVKEFDQRDHCLYNWSMISLIHHLAMAGWDCRSGFFSKTPGDPWLRAIVYNSQCDPFDLRKTRWYDLSDAGLLPESLCRGIQKYGYARERDLVVPWLDRSLQWFGKH